MILVKGARPHVIIIHCNPAAPGPKVLVKDPKTLVKDPTILNLVPQSAHIPVVLVLRAAELIDPPVSTRGR